MHRYSRYYKIPFHRDSTIFTPESNVEECLFSHRLAIRVKFFLFSVNLQRWEMVSQSSFSLYLLPNKSIWWSFHVVKGQCVTFLTCLWTLSSGLCPFSMQFLAFFKLLFLRVLFSALEVLHFICDLLQILSPVCHFCLL